MSSRNRRRKQSIAPPPPILDLNILKTTQSMRKSLDGLHSCLFCPLCNQVFNDPVTLPACAHTFCQKCINDYSCNNIECPVSSCGLPITLRGTRVGKFDKTNPQIETVVSSFRIICSTLNASPNQWWKEPKPNEPSQEEKLLEMGGVEGNETYTFSMPKDDAEFENDGDTGNKNHTMEEDAVMETGEEGIMENLSMEDDDDPTDPFPVESNSQGSMTSTRSCALPSISPNCSMIAPADSQMTPLNNDFAKQPSPINETTIMDKTVFFYERKEPEKIQIFNATKIPPKNSTVLNNLEKSGIIEIVDGIMNEKVVAVCGNAEMETGEGWLVGLTFGYLWAMALGVPILYVTYFQNDLKFPFPKPDVKHRVIGVGSSMDWMGPQRAVQAKKEGVLLFEDYTFILVGDFDKLQQKSRRTSSNRDSSTIYSKERISTLLKLCGAMVYEQISDMEDIENNDKAAFLIRPKPRSRDWRNSRKAVEAGAPSETKNLPIVCANWLLESLADYRCKELQNYTQQTQ